MKKQVLKGAQAGLNGFSAGFVLLQLAPFFIVLAFCLMAAVKFEVLSLNRALAVMLIALAITYISLPALAARVREGIGAFKYMKKRVA